MPSREILTGIVTALAAVAALAFLRREPAPPPESPPPVYQVTVNSAVVPDRSRDFIAGAADVRQPDLSPARPDAVAAQLEKVVPEVSLNGVKLSDALEWVESETGALVWPNWRALEAAGINHDAPVTVRLRNVKAGRVLKVILDDVGGGNVKLAFRCEDGMVTVSTADQLERFAVTRIYDVRDIIVGAMQWSGQAAARAKAAEQAELEALARRQATGGAAPAAAASQSAPPPVPQSSGGGSGSTPAGGAFTAAPPPALTEMEIMDALVRLIQETVDPTVWRDAGGSIGAVRAFCGRLIITQTPENHRAVTDLLNAIRASGFDPATVPPKGARPRRRRSRPTGRSPRPRSMCRRSDLGKSSC